MSSEPEPTLQSRLDALRRGYLSELPRRLREIEQARAVVWPGDLGALERLRYHIHKLSGSGAVFGCPEVSAAASAIERRLDEAIALGQITARDFAALDADFAGLARACAGYFS
ncbi:MAG: Hpt domain-containing protein [Dehalococcoidia bacterium]